MVRKKCGRSVNQKNDNAGRQNWDLKKKPQFRLFSQNHTKFSAMNNYWNTYIVYDFTRLVCCIKENKTIRFNYHVYMMTSRRNSINYADDPRSKSVVIFRIRTSYETLRTIKIFETRSRTYIVVYYEWFIVWKPFIYILM